MNLSSFAAIGSVAYKEFLHIRDRASDLLLILPPFRHLGTLSIGEAGLAAILVHHDPTPATERFVDCFRQRTSARTGAGQGDESDSFGSVSGPLSSSRAAGAYPYPGDPSVRLSLMASTPYGRTTAGSLQKTLVFSKNSAKDVDALPVRSSVEECDRRRSNSSRETAWRREGILYIPRSGYDYGCPA